MHRLFFCVLSFVLVVTKCLVCSEHIVHTAKEKPLIFVIFGASGDLTSRKLIPALYHLSQSGQLPSQFACVGVSKGDTDTASFRKTVGSAVSQFCNARAEDAFLNKFLFTQVDFNQDADYEKLKEQISKIESNFSAPSEKIFYLATHSQFFPVIVQELSKYNLVSDRTSRVIFEKPFGHDLKSAQTLKNKIYAYLLPDQIFQIDHFLGKEGVQNILSFRFSNPIFEELWSNKYIDNIQITIAEDIGIGTRGDFFEKTGILRDLVQNHLMQILSLVAMERPKNFNPKNFDADAIQKEKIKVVRSIRKFPLDDLIHSVVRGQYTQNGDTYGYLQEKNVSSNSQVETYFAARLFIDNDQWRNVPFYIRAGKRLKAKMTEVVITFKKPQNYPQASKPNVLVLNIQPKEEVSLQVNSKAGYGSLDLNIKDAKQRTKDAYEQLLKDAIDGNRSNFVNFDELLASWELFSPVIDTRDTPLLPYPAGSWGPDSSLLFEREGQGWYDESK